jgi:DNA-directed RNA polymerase specialized sigma24 family protein
MPDARPPDRETARLDEIPTQWSLMRQAHQNSLATSGPARGTLALRYSSAIRSYIGAILKDTQDADELAQEVLVRIIRGDFASATPERGRFRDLLKVALRNMVRTHWSRSQRRTGVALDVTQLAEEVAREPDAEWDAAWQRSLLALAWRSLQDYETSQAGSVAYTLLRLRADFPDDDIDQLGERLKERTGRELGSAAVRQQLRRARLRFAEMLVEEVAKSVDDPTPDRVAEELIETGLMPYVRDFLPEDWHTSGELCDAHEATT